MTTDSAIQASSPSTEIQLSSTRLNAMPAITPATMADHRLARHHAAVVTAILDGGQGRQVIRRECGGDQQRAEGCGGGDAHSDDESTTPRIWVVGHRVLHV